MSYTDPQIGTLTITGDPARFVATERVPVSGVSMDFEPVQDLHGQEYPYPAGGGVNNLAPSPSGTVSQNSVTAKSDGNGSYSISGTATGGSANLSFTPSAQYTIKTGDYLHMMNSVANASAVITLLFTDNTSAAQSMTPINRIWSLENYVGKTITTIRFYIASGASYTATVKPMIVNSSTAIDFAPYSNICPITGRDSVNVYVSPEQTITDGTEVREIEFPLQGFNQWDEEWENGTFDTSTGTNINNTQTNQQIRSKNLIPIKGGASYYFQAYPSIWAMFYDENMNIIAPTASGHQISNKAIKLGTSGEGSPVYSVPDDAKYFKFYEQVSYGATYKNDISINYPATETGYHPYEGRTVYAGTLTINDDGSGQIVCTMAVLDMGNLGWNIYDPNETNIPVFLAMISDLKIATRKILTPIYRATGWQRLNDRTDFTICAHPTLPLVYPADSRYNDYIEYRTAMRGVQIVYELAEPVTIQLDPIEITTLIGLNYVWTSDNNLITISFPYNKEVQPMSLTYEHCWTYPKAYIDKLEARIAALETAAEAKTAAAPADTRETVAEEITVTEEPETEPVTKKGGK